MFGTSKNKKHTENWQRPTMLDLNMFIYIYIVYYRYLLPNAPILGIFRGYHFANGDSIVLHRVMLPNQNHHGDLHPWKLTWRWEITIFNRKYIFFHGGFSIAMLVLGGTGTISRKFRKKRYKQTKSKLATGHSTVSTKSPVCCCKG